VTVTSLPGFVRDEVNAQSFIINYLMWLWCCVVLEYVGGGLGLFLLLPQEWLVS
jgi:hypothetical protein